MQKITYKKRGLVRVKPAKGEHIVHNKEKCTACGNCIVVCSMDLWQKRGDAVQLAGNYKQYCLECASCFNVCDQGAVEFTFPEGGYGVVYAHG